MKSQNALSILLVVILSVTSHVFAQEKTKPKSPDEPPSADYKILTKSNLSDGDLVTIVKLQRMWIASPDKESEPIGFSSMFAYDQKSQAVPAAYISFYSTAPNCRFPSKTAVTFTAAGQAIRITDDPEGARGGEGSAMSLSEREDDRCNESLDVLLPQTLYLTIANAQTVEVQIGELKFDLNENHLQALRELSRRMVAAKT